MKKPDFMILVCNSYRVAGDAQGACNRKGATSLLQYISEGCSDRRINAVVSTTACLNLCAQGPVMVVQPNNFWYGAINEERIDAILDALESGESVKEYLIAD